jgi:hypothetical protein
MKAVAVILAFYIIALSTVQCADVLEGNNIALVEQLSADNHDHQDSEVPEDDCSPFCSCMCCQLQIHVYKPFPLTSENIEFDLMSDYTFYSQTYAGQYLEAPFHPPKSVA